MVATALAASAWFALVAWRPTTTWHLAPALVAGVGAWLVAYGRPESMVRPKEIGLLAASGLAVAWAEAVVFQAHGRLEGPVLMGENAGVESAAVAALASILVAIFGGRRVARARSDAPE